MRSNTLTPLLQFTEWFGLSPFRANGINYPKKTSISGKCNCTLQHSWQSKNEWTRDDLTNMLSIAEDFFIRETGFHPAPFQITGELQNYKVNGKIINANGEFKSVKPDYSCRINEFGTYNLSFVGYIDLIREDEDGIVDVFQGQAALPSGTNIEDIKIYYTEVDGNYAGALNYNSDKILEIRPLRSSYIINNIFYLNEPAYLFKKPSLDELDTCVDHELTTYVEQVALYILKISPCTHGNFIFNSASPCATPDCSEYKSVVCIQKRYVGKEIWAVPMPYTCTLDGDGSYTRNSYRLMGMPKAVELNYITGEKLTKGEMNSRYFNTIAKIAVGLADCVREFCNCEDCADQKIKYYHSVMRVKTEDPDPASRAVGDQYQVLLSPQSLALVKGLPPYTGLVEGMYETLSYSCKG